MLSKKKKKELNNLEIKFRIKKEFMAEIIPALENYEIALIRMQQEIFFLTKNPDIIVTIQSFHEYMRDRTKEVIIMHEKNGAKAHSTEPQQSED